MKELDLFESNNFLELPVIVANMNIDYHAPITLDQKIRVGLKISRIGTKSMQYDYVIEDMETGEIAAKATSIMVTYDYHTRKSVPVPDEWRAKITEFEGLEL
jgi:acyl-CoA thioester hydrolase